jgi:hypothetical protein
VTDIDRLISAVVEFSAQNRTLAGLRRAKRRCTEYSRPDYSCGDPGTPECQYITDLAEDDFCDACKARKANLPVYRTALRNRAAAKRRMIRWAEKIAARQDARKAGEGDRA